MKNKKEKLPPRPLRAVIADDLAPVLLSTAVISASTYIYVHTSAAAIVLYTLLSFALSCMIFAIYDVLRYYGKIWLNTIVVIVMLYLGMSSYILAEEPRELLLWFMEPSRFTHIYYGRTFSLAVMFGTVLISCLYYFTMIRYRGIFVFLICLCPFCLFAKTFTDIPVIFPIIIMTLFFFIMTGHSGKNSLTGELISSGKKGVRFAVTGFVLAVTVIASFMPKLEFAPYREVFDEFVTGVTISAAEAAANFTDFSQSSSTATSGDDDTVVLYLYGDNPGLLKRQCFNFYDGKDNVWKYFGDSENGSAAWQTYTAFEDPSELYRLADFKGGKISSGRCRFVPVSGGVRALYTPENLTGLSLPSADTKIYRTENDEYFITAGESSEVNSYIITWSNVETDTGFSGMFTNEFAERLTYNSDDADAVYSYLRSKEQAVRYDSYLLSDEVLNKCYSSPARRNEIQKLTNEITAGHDSPYDKAKAIEQFFLSGEYIYDRDYIAPNPSPDYFILNFKRGACAKYATAMTLMCREAGLTARYCEGFSIHRYSPEGYWYATASDGHAYVQVWLDGYGWTDFNPTSSVTGGNGGDLTFVIVGIIAALIVIGGTAAMIFRPVIAERRFIGKASKTRGAQHYSLIYARINSMLNSYLGNKENTFTPTETAYKVISLFGYDISGFAERYENAVYGGISDSNANETDVYTGFREAYRNRIKSDKKEKKAKKK